MQLNIETKQRLNQVSLGTLSTVLFRKGYRTRYMSGLLPINVQFSRFVAPAFTLRFIPAREDIDTMDQYSSDKHVQRRAIEECPADHVLVISTGNDVQSASAGDIMLARLQQRGVAAVVTDGGFRDTSDIFALNFPAFQKQTVIPSSPITLHPVDLNQPIGCAGVAIYPGDILVGDAEGVIAIPAEIVDEVAEEAFKQSDYEKFVVEKVSEGRSLFGLFPANQTTLDEYQSWLSGKK